MNIAQAKEQIEYAVRAYLTKNEYGEPAIPSERQRPLFLMGAPGIGKTAIMEQVAQEMGIGLVSYSMTHHTRQSALGLPFIAHRVYQGKEYDVSEYTMSEIISSVYESMEQNGTEQGILFLDEINCVSETLAPSMLQFLQFKTFGRHRVPEGWVVVTAGNPPEYNRSVREFDIATWDRLKRIDIEPDVEAWRPYALSHGVHPSVMTYLDIKKESFYKVGTTVTGRSFVTARGWSDLSDMIRLFEQNGFPVDERLIGQYLQDQDIAHDFSLYYELYRKYREDYHVEDILAGRASEEVRERARNARFDERVTLLGLLRDGLSPAWKSLALGEDTLRIFLDSVKALRTKEDGEPLANRMKDTAKELREQSRREKAANSAPHRRILAQLRAAEMLTGSAETIDAGADEKTALLQVRGEYETVRAELDRQAEEARARMETLFAFCEETFGPGHELLLLVMALTSDADAAGFIARYGCDAYYRHSGALMLGERRSGLNRELAELMDGE